MKNTMRVQWLCLAVLVALAYIPAFDWMIDRWSAKDTYYGHGFLVPFISAFLVWVRRRELSALAVKPSSWGWPLFSVGILVYLVSAVLRVYSTSGLSLLIVITGLILIFLGRDQFKVLWFPVAFLSFMIPLPLVVIANISFKLKIIAAEASARMINMMGVPAVRDGSVIKTTHAYVVVEDPCSGIRSLLALIALGALMAYLSRLSARRQWALFLSSVPIAVLTNIVRIVTVSLASEMYGSTFATGAFHDGMGLVVFVLAFCGLALVANLLEVPIQEKQ